ncbi:unnamed protein product [Mytilus coruscus]|uniref:CCHC-type domain-containing protein n=1 Tax=Mytilus coruscus TaxID=42192 RepID=A0A6J8CGD3_MYTCO|nr:unnamed protein product [Mytilus coruscus]
MIGHVLVFQVLLAYNRYAQCPNDWKCLNCGESGHKQSDCTNDDFADGESAEHNDTTEQVDVPVNIDQYSNHEQTDNNDDHEQTDNYDDNEATQMPPGLQPLTNSSYSDIDQSQSILSTAVDTNPNPAKSDQQGARPKALPARKTCLTNTATCSDRSKQLRNTGQTNITQFVYANQESRNARRNDNKQVNTPAKPTSGRGIQKSPITPPEELHDGTCKTANKRSRIKP